MHNLQTIKKLSTIFTICLGLCACDPISGRETVGEYVDDSTITAKVKSEILESPSLKSYRIKVETLQNVVQLSGFVDSAGEKRLAEQLAKKVSGVKLVKNNLIIR